MMDLLPNNAAVLFRELVREIPEYERELAEHLESNEGLLPYPAMDDFGAYLIDSIRRSELVSDEKEKERHLNIIKRGISFIERTMQSDDPEVKLLIKSTIVDSIR